MEKITFITMENLEGKPVEYVIIDHGNEEFTSMRKDMYDAQQAAQASKEVKPTK